MKKIKKIIYSLIIVIILLGAVLISAKVQQINNQLTERDLFIKQLINPSMEKGFLEGKITIGPLCSVMTNPPNPKCLPTEKTYKKWPVSVYTFDKKIKIAEIEPDIEGNYKIELPVGRYIIDLEKNQHSTNDLPITININSGKTEILDIDIDTGIR